MSDRKTYTLDKQDHLVPGLISQIRHGESTDNLKACWAGHADAPLSNHGMNQAKALGDSLKDVSFDAIFASDLKRAHWTAQQVEKHQSCTLTLSPLLREQNFGIAERKPFGDAGFSRQPGRSFRFPGGESLDDVRQRANEVLNTFLVPLITSSHVAVVAHGIFNAELIGACLARRNKPESTSWAYKGMTNTGWTRLRIEPEASASGAAVGLTITIECSDVTTHLDGVHRQKGGIGSQGYDEKQRSLRAFFSGAK